MPRLAPVSWRELIRRLHKLGFEGPYQGGKHPYLVRGELVLAIPNPHREEITVDLLKQILKRGHISRDEWFKAS